MTDGRVIIALTRIFINLEIASPGERRRDGDGQNKAHDVANQNGWIAALHGCCKLADVARL
jgi:hypothetical protein